MHGMALSGGFGDVPCHTTVEIPTLYTKTNSGYDSEHNHANKYNVRIVICILLPCIFPSVVPTTIIVGTISIIKVLLSIVVVSQVVIVLGEIVILWLPHIVLSFVLVILRLLILIIVGIGHRVGIRALVELRQLIDTLLLEPGEILLRCFTVHTGCVCVAEDIP